VLAMGANDNSRFLIRKDRDPKEMNILYEKNDNRLLLLALCTLVVFQWSLFDILGIPSINNHGFLFL
jgi:hypothetical protein